MDAVVGSVHGSELLMRTRRECSTADSGNGRAVAVHIMCSQWAHCSASQRLPSSAVPHPPCISLSKSSPQTIRTCTCTEAELEPCSLAGSFSCLWLRRPPLLPDCACCCGAAACCCWGSAAVATGALCTRLLLVLRCCSSSGWCRAGLNLPAACRRGGAKRRCGAAAAAVAAPAPHPAGDMAFSKSRACDEWLGKVLRATNASHRQSPSPRGPPRCRACAAPAEHSETTCGSRDNLAGAGKAGQVARRRLTGRRQDAGRAERNRSTPL